MCMGLEKFLNKCSIYVESPFADSIESGRSTVLSDLGPSEFDFKVSPVI